MLSAQRLGDDSRTTGLEVNLESGLPQARDQAARQRWIIFDEKEAGYATLNEAKEIVGELMTLYNEVNASVVEDRVALPTDCAFRDEVLANLEDGAPISQWSRGFLRGHQWLEELWNAYVPKKLDDEFSAALLTLTFFASKELAEAFHTEAGNKERSLEAMAGTIRGVFPEAIAEYAHLGRSIHLALLETAAEPRRSVKIGRNELCPCGSGRKYKKCCGAPRVPPRAHRGVPVSEDPGRQRAISEVKKTELRRTGRCQLSNVTIDVQTASAEYGKTRSP